MRLAGAIVAVGIAGALAAAAPARASWEDAGTGLPAAAGGGVELALVAGTPHAALLRPDGVHVLALDEAAGRWTDLAGAGGSLGDPARPSVRSFRLAAVGDGACVAQATSDSGGTAQQIDVRCGMGWSRRGGPVTPVSSEPLEVGALVEFGGTAFVGWRQGTAVHVSALPAGDSAWTEVGSAAQLARPDVAGTPRGAPVLTVAGGRVVAAWLQGDGAQASVLAADAPVDRSAGWEPLDQANTSSATNPQQVELSALGGRPLVGWRDGAVRWALGNGGRGWTQLTNAGGADPTAGATDFDLQTDGTDVLESWTLGSELRVRRLSPGFTVLLGPAVPVAAGASGATAIASAGQPIVAWLDPVASGGRQARVQRLWADPVPGTDGESDVTNSGATLRADLRTYGFPTAVSVEVVAGGQTTLRSAGRYTSSTGDASSHVTVTLTRFPPDTELRWRLLATAGGAVHQVSPTRTFTTAPAAVDPSPTGPPASTPPAPEPDLGDAGTAAAVRGEVLVRLPGGPKAVPIGEGPAALPVGSVVDATAGRVELLFATPSGGEQHAVFYAGVFRVVSQSTRTGLVTLELVDLPCATGRAPRVAPARTRGGRTKGGGRKVVGRLWGDGKGRFRTKGRYGAAAVRGTKWLTEDTCTSTTVTVERGLVAVEDLVKKLTSLVKAGRSYVARARR